jgi:hypothetical protein
MRPEEAKYQLEMIMPYVKSLRHDVMRGERVKRREEVIVFKAPLTDQQRIDKVSEELHLIAQSAKYSGDGSEL